MPSVIELHLAINHSPLFAEIFAFVLLVIALVRRNRTLGTAALVVAIVGALCAGAAYYTGDEAAETVDKSTPIAGLDKTLIKEHDQAAWFALAAACISGGLALIALIVGWRRGERLRWLDILIAVVILWTVSVVGRTAFLGGQIHHPEVREGTKTE
jgi:hypothetical protein